LRESQFGAMAKGLKRKAAAPATRDTRKGKEPRKDKESQT
jgi:hypothetical protein